MVKVGGGGRCQKTSATIAEQLPGQGKPSRRSKALKSADQLLQKAAAAGAGSADQLPAARNDVYLPGLDRRAGSRSNADQLLSEKKN